MKQINQLGRVLGKILADLIGLKTNGQVGEGIEAAEQALKNELELEIDDLISIPAEKFIQILQEKKKFSDDDFEKLADIFYLIAEELEQKGTNNEKMKKFYERSLIIYKYLDKTGSTYSFDRHLKIDKMKKVFLFFMFIMSTMISCSQTQDSEKVTQLEKERKEKEIFDTYINNSLQNGSTPYADCYGANKNCSEWGCSEIRVKTPTNSDVLVTIKSGGKVVQHAYISAGNSFTFEIPDGTYQPFFYYGKGWNPEKLMKSIPGCELTGGFISEETFGKDDPQKLTNSILEYELILQQNGNFSTIPSNPGEAF